MRPFTLLIKPAGPDCNLVCSHCFYSCKNELFEAGPHRMSDEILEKLVKDYLGLRFQNNSFCWQGGEPTLMGLDFYKCAVELQRKYAKGQIVSNALQTNGTLLNDDWCKFLTEYNFLLGISLDGPESTHDFYRKDKRGKGSFAAAMAGVEACRRNKTEFNILTLLTNNNAHKCKELFDFYIDNDFMFVQLIPCIELADGKIAPFSITADDYGRFLCEFFDLWVKHVPDKMSVRLFDSIAAYYVHGQHAICCFNKRCNDYIVVEHNGDIYVCDFFVEPGWKVGNLMLEPIGELANAKLKTEFSDMKAKTDSGCFVCRHFSICRGGCLKERLASGGFAKKSFYCESYKMFFDHAAPTLQRLGFEAVNRQKA